MDIFEPYVEDGSDQIETKSNFKLVIRRNRWAHLLAHV
jgi:hypothetical protein